jgi:putative lipoprotein
MAAIVMLALPAVAGEIRDIEGSVFWRDSFRPPEDARLVLRLVAIGEGPGQLDELASISVAAGRSPVLFRLAHDVALAPPGRDYRLLAEIRAGGNLVMRNREAQPVVPGSGESVDIEVRRFSIARGEGSPVGREWVAERLGGERVPAWARVSVRFRDDERITGSTGCNRLEGRVELGEETLDFEDVTLTNRGCRTLQRRLEKDVMRALHAVTGWQIRNRELVLLDAAGLALMRLREGPMR